jgi:hypothetical protein
VDWSTEHGRCSREEIIQMNRSLCRPRSAEGLQDRVVADFLAVLGIIGFAGVMLGLIWALDRV